MPQIGWYNVEDGRIYPLNAYEALYNVVPPYVLQDILDRREADERHKADALTVTGPMGCPRKMAIERMTDFVVDFKKHWPMDGGTALHKSFEVKAREERSASGQPVWFDELAHPEKCTFKGKIWGQDISGVADLVRRDVYDPSLTNDFPFNGKGRVDDYKFSFSGADKWIARSRMARESHTVQANFLRELMKQQLGRDMDEVEFVFWVVGTKWEKTVAPVLSIDGCGASPFGSTGNSSRIWTVRELFDANVRVFEAWREAAREYDGDLMAVPMAKREEIARSAEKAGADFWVKRNGANMCTDYCTLRKSCEGLEGGL